MKTHRHKTKQIETLADGSETSLRVRGVKNSEVTLQAEEEHALAVGA